MYVYFFFSRFSFLDSFVWFFDAAQNFSSPFWKQMERYFCFISDAHINFVKQLVIRFPAFHTIEVLHLRPHSFVGCDRSFIYVSKRIRSTRIGVLPDLMMYCIFGL